MAAAKKQEAPADGAAPPPADRISALVQSKVFAAIRTQFGAGILTRASEARLKVVPKLPTGVMALDYALGGGWPIGRVSLVFGMKSTGKSTLMTLAVAQAQRMCGRCYTFPEEGKCACGDFRGMSSAMIDVEGSWSNEHGERLGVDPEKMLLARPDHAEQALDICEALIRSGECDVIVLDSIAFLSPEKEILESVAGSSWIVTRTAEGTKPVQIQDMAAFPPSALDHLTVRGYDLGTSSFTWAKVRKVWKCPASDKRLYRIRTQYGRVLVVTEDHSLYRVHPANARRDKTRKMLVAEGEVVEVKGSDVVVGDYMLLDVTPGAEETGEDTTLSLDPSGFILGVLDTGEEILKTRRGSWARSELPVSRLAYLVGFYTGNGWLNETALGLSVAEARRDSVLLRFGTDLGGLISSPIGCYPAGGSACSVLSISCSPLVKRFRAWFGGQHAPTKRVPAELFRWHKPALLAFLEGLLASDGHSRGAADYSYQYGATVGFTTTSEGLVEDVLEILRMLGVRAGVRGPFPPKTVQIKKPDGSYQTAVGRHAFWRVEWSANALAGNRSGRAGTRRSWLSVPSGTPVKVLKVEEVSSEDVYDIEISGGSPTFVANGLLVHNSVSKDQVGVQARVSGKAVRKFVAALNAIGNAQDGWKPTVLLTNQIRMKVGVLFGCFHADTLVAFADGSRVPIQRVVEDSLEGPVLSWDGGQIVERKIKSWHMNGLLPEDEAWLDVRLEGGGSFTCTRDHVVVDGDGIERHASWIASGKELLSGAGGRVRVASCAYLIQRHKLSMYDLGIEGDSFYVAGSGPGVVVHNSPETQPGGLAWGFATAAEVKTRSSKYKMDEASGRPLYVDISFRVEKNKVAVPKMEGDFRFMLADTERQKAFTVADQGFIMAQAERLGLLTGHGSSWEMLGVKFKSKTSVEEALLTDPAFNALVRKSLMQVLLSV